jgi:uncharacterized membrane protein YcaP (DUF421 family)
VDIEKDWLEALFGSTPEDLTPLQMSLRAMLIFLICLCLIRFCGRRAFGMHTAFDNVVAVLLGAVLSRAVVGASPFVATIAAGAAIVVIHRFTAWLGMRSHLIGKLVKGEVGVLYENGRVNNETMRKHRISERDLMEGVRLSANVDSLDEIEKIYVERNGKISVIKKSR